MGLSSQSDREISNQVVVVASIFAGIGVAHLIDDFLYGVPEEFNLSNEAAQVLGFAFFLALTGLISLAGRGNRRSYLGLVIIGLLLAVADLTKHVPEILAAGTFRSGWISVFFSTGLILSGVILALVSINAMIKTRPPHSN